MNAKSQRPKRRDGAISPLNAAIEALNLAKEISSATPAKAVFGSVSAILTMIRDSMVNELDYVDLGLSCADVCRALDRGMGGRGLDELSQPVCDAINQLTTTVAEIQRKVIEQSGRNSALRLFHAKKDKETIATWKVDLNRILHIFNTELTINTHLMVADIHRNALTGQEGTERQHRSTQPSIPLGESPPPPPRACFGRDELIERIIGHAENLAPIALIGAGGIGKTSVALAVLHHDRIKERFGDNRRFIRCDQFPASRANFLGRLSKVIGAGVENPEDMTPLRPHLSSKEMVITLDNAESILDPRGVNAGDIFAVVEELSQFSNICLCITSRITTIPADCRCLDVPTLAMDAARSAFYHIYGNDERPDLINDILKQLDFHPLSVALLATVGHHNGWGADRLAMEWGQRQTDVLRTEHSKSLAATIELSLASPMFLELGSDARDLLGVVAFFPQGVCENNLDWLFSRRNTFSRLFPTISDRLFPANSERKNVFDKFCVLSLTYRSNGFITMLAPLRDYFYPKSPESSSLLRTTKKCYFHRLSASTNLDSNPNFGETQWITSEDVNVEHLLDIFTSIDANSDKVWKACADFMRHLYWHKPRLTVLGPKMEGLPNDHRSKLECLLELSRLFERVGNFMECKRLLTLILQLWRERGDDYWVAPALRRLSNANRLMGLHEEGIQQAKEALEIFERLGDTVEQAECLNCLALLLLEDEQLDAAGEAVSRSINLLDKGERFSVCGSHHLLGNIYRSKGEREKAIFHFEVALGIASSFNWHDHLFWIHDSLAQLFLDEDRFDDAHTHVEQAKSHVVNDTYFLGRAMGLQAMVWYKQGRLAEARSEASHAADVYEKLGAVQDLEDCRGFLRQIEGKMNNPVASG